MIYTKKNTMEAVLKQLPEFNSAWNEHLAYWRGDKTRTIWSDMSALSTYVVKNIPKIPLEKRKAFFDFIEILVKDGDGDVSNAVCTCFLENLQNNSPNNISPETFVPFLGKESRKFCKGWDEFTGVKTAGL